MSAAAQSQEKTRAQPSNYRRDLRAIGQALEKRQYTTFNLKCSDDGYFVWSTETVEPSHLGLSSITKGEIVASASGGDGAVKMLVDRIVGFQCSGGDIERLDREGTQNRRRRIGVADGRGLSQLLRTLGDQLLRRNQRLLAIAWHERWIGVVTETAGRRREINVLRTDNLYDLWVRMYLQRSH